MDTKSKGDIAEQSAILVALKLGWGVLKPVGDRLPYDLVFDVGGRLVKVQVKYAWLDKNSLNFVVYSVRTKTNRRVMKKEEYKEGDFDFALVYIHPLELFYVMPFAAFVEHTSVSMIEFQGRQRQGSTKRFRNAWNLIQEWALPGETQVRLSVKVGEACDVVIPSQACESKKV